MIPIMSERTTGWYPMDIIPVRDGWYEIDTADLLHFDTHMRTWGVWFPQQPGVRHIVAVGHHLRWRGPAEQP
jgi:hypothetical protein